MNWHAPPKEKGALLHAPISKKLGLPQNNSRTGFAQVCAGCWFRNFQILLTSSKQRGGKRAAPALQIKWPQLNRTRKETKK